MATDHILLLYYSLQDYLKIIEPSHNKTSKMTFAASEDSDQPVHLLSLISLCCWPEESSGPLPSLKALSKDWSDWADAQADQSLHWVHKSFCWFLSCSGSIKQTLLQWQITEATAPSTCSRHKTKTHAMSRFKFVSAEMEASFEKLLNAKKKMNKIKRKSLWLKKFLAIKNKKKKWVSMSWPWKSEAMFPETRHFLVYLHRFCLETYLLLDGLTSRDEDSHLAACNR